MKKKKKQRIRLIKDNYFKSTVWLNLFNNRLFIYFFSYTRMSPSRKET